MTCACGGRGREGGRGERGKEEGKKGEGRREEEGEGCVHRCNGAQQIATTDITT